MFTFNSRNLYEKTVTSDYTATEKDDIIKVDASSGTVNVTLYSLYDGGEHCVGVQKSDSSANAVTVTVAGSGTINGSSTLTLSAQYAGVILVIDKSGNWINFAGEQFAMPGVAGVVEANKIIVAGATKNLDVLLVDTFTPNAIAGGDSSLGITGQATTQGGAIAVTGGTSSTSGNAGGAVSMTGGTPGATGVGGAASVVGGVGGSTSGAGGAASLTGGAGSGVTTVGGAVAIAGGAGGAGATTSAGGVGGALSLASGAGGAKAGTGAAAGGAAGALSIIGGAGGATANSSTSAGGAGAAVTVTAGVGGAATAGTGNGGAGGIASLVGGAGGATTGGTGGAGGNVVLTPGAAAGAGVGGVIRNNGTIIRKQGTPSTPTTALTMTVANLMIGILTATPTATGATVVYTLPLGTDMETGASFSDNDSFDWSITNLAAAAADTITITANTAHTIVGNPIVQSAHATTGGITGNAAVFRSRRTSSGVWVTYRFA